MRRRYPSGPTLTTSFESTCRSLTNSGCERRNAWTAPLRAVPDAPRPVADELGGDVLDDRVEDDAVAPDGRERTVDLELREDMLMGVIAVEDHHHRHSSSGESLDLGDELRSDARTLEHRDAALERVGFDGYAVVGSDVDVESDDRRVRRAAARRVELEHRCREDQRPAMRNPGLDDHAGLYPPDDLLQTRGRLGGTG